MDEYRTGRRTADRAQKVTSGALLMTFFIST